MSIVTCLIFVNDDRDKMVRAHSRAARGNNLPESSMQLAALRFGGVVNGQVLASLLVSVTLVGIKLNAAKEIVQTIERRKELLVNLSLLQRGLEAEDKKAWIVDVIHDTKHREDREKIKKWGWRIPRWGGKELGNCMRRRLAGREA